jgi:iron complex outermembrane receptor protein
LNPKTKAPGRLALTAAPGAIAVLVCLSPLPAHADDAAMSAPVVDGSPSEIIVTARKRNEDIKDVPIAVSVLSARQLDAGHQYQLIDLNTLTPSINVSYFNSRGNYFSLRGLGNNPTADGLETSVGVFVDGVYLGRSGMMSLDFVDLDRIEILKGPQGTLFGKNTSAGAISITTSAPRFDTGGSVDVSAGNYDYLQTRGSVTGTLVPGFVAGRLSWYDTSHDGYITNVINGEDTNNGRRQGARAQLLITPATELSIRLIGEYDHEDDHCCAQVLASFGAANSTFQSRVEAAGGTAILGLSDYTTTLDDTDRMRTYQASGTAIVEQGMGPVSLTSVTGYRNWHYRAVYDTDNTNARAYVLGVASPSDDWQVSQELRLATTGGGPIDVTAGLFYFHQYIATRNRTQFDDLYANYVSNSTKPPASNVAFNDQIQDTFSNVTTDSYAAFGQATWHATSRLDLTGGIRGTYETKSDTVNRPKNTTQSAYFGELDIHGFDPSWTAAVNYRLLPELSAYVAYERGVKSGGLNPIVPAAGITASQLEVAPEKTDNYEAGLKLASGVIRVSADVYYEKVHDYQATENQTIGQSAVNFLSNVGDVTAWGSELEINLLPAAGLELSVNGSYNNTTYDNYVNALCPVESAAKVCDLTGQQVVNAPRWAGSTTARYEFSLNERMRAFLGGNAAYRGRYNGYISNSVYSRMGDYALVNFDAGLRFPQSDWDATFWIKNAFDKHYATTSVAGGTSQYYGAYFVSVGDPRTFGLTLHKSF